MTAVQDEGGEESKWHHAIQHSDALHYDTKYNVAHIFDFKLSVVIRYTECHHYVDSNIL